MTRPIGSARLPSGLRRFAARLLRTWPFLFLALAAALVWVIWAGKTPVLTPRHRPEALWFALAQTHFAPPMTVEPSAAMVRGRFNLHTPAHLAVREAMRFTDDMVIEERTRRVGDFDVSVLWLRIPGGRGHWLVLAWMEEGDLGVTSFRFDVTETDLSPEEVVWANRLLHRVLVADHFRAGVVPSIGLRSKSGGPPAAFGPQRAD